MATLTLTGQEVLAGQVTTRVTQLKDSMNQRKEIWDRLPLAKKKAWITSGKDPIMTLSWNTYRYLRDNFFGEEERYG